MKKGDAWVAAALVSKFLEINKVTTMSGIYARVNPGPDSKIRTVLSPAATETGRFGSSASFLDRSTNLQNLPKKTANLSPLYNVRSVIVPSPGKVLMSGDYSAAERRLLAYLARERTAIKQIESGINTYKWFAAKLYGISDWSSIPKSDPMYHIGKMGVLAFDRGVTWRTFMDQVNKDADLTGVTITSKVARGAEELFHGVFPGYKRYYTEVLRHLQTSDWTMTNVAGRRRTFYARHFSDAERMAVVREAVSFQAQAIGDIINERLAIIYRRHDPELLQLLLQVHDDIIWETTEANWKKAGKAVKTILELPVMVHGKPLSIPAEISMSTTSWADLKEVTDDLLQP